MSIQALSSVSQFHVRPILRDALISNLDMASPETAKFFSAESRSLVADFYAREAAEILHDLGGLAAKW